MECTHDTDQIVSYRILSRINSKNTRYMRQRQYMPVCTSTEILQSYTVPFADPGQTNDRRTHTTMTSPEKRDDAQTQT